jgi:EmrB/QacA subfamily drug resistance transporter
MTSPTTAPPAPAETESVRLVILSIGLLLFLASLDQTIVSTALPTIVSDLGGLEHLSWVVTAYVLTSTVVAPLYGKLGDLYGRRNMTFISVGLFLLGSMLCGVAQSMEFLIFSRALQGLGGGGLFVLALSVIGDVIRPQDRGKIQGVFAAVFSISSVMGPLLGGWFVEAVSWHWIFFINIPVGIVAVLGFAASFKPRGIRVRHKIDWAGALALTLALGSLTLVTSLGGRSFAWSSPAAIGLCSLSALSLIAFLWIETRAEEPILPLSLFKLNVFWVTGIIGFIAGASMFGTITFLPLYLQIAKGTSPTVSGLLLIPMTAGILTASTITGRTMSRTGRYRIFPIIGLSLLALGMVALSYLARDTTYVIFGLSLMVVGLGMGCIFPVVTTSVQNAVPRQVLGTATAAGVMIRQTGGSLGVAVFGAIFAARMSLPLEEAAKQLGAAVQLRPEAMAKLPPELQASLAEAVIHAIQPIYLIAAALALSGLVFAFFLHEIPLQSHHLPRGE